MSKSMTEKANYYPPINLTEKNGRIKQAIEVIENYGEVATLIDFMSVFEFTKRQTQIYLNKLKRRGYIEYDEGYTNFKIIKYPKTLQKEKETQSLKRKSRELYEWKQQEYLKLYLDGLAFVHGTNLKSSDKVKQNDINYKILSRIDDPIILDIIRGVETA